MNSEVFFSVVIPTYNREQLLPITIDTVLTQSFQDFEIIVVDDGSTDNTNKIILEKYSKISKVRYFKKENEERGRARNFGYENSNGKYIVFFDSDDIMLHNHLTVLFEFIQHLNQPNFIATKHLLITESGKIFYNQAKNLSEGWYDFQHLLDGNWLASHFAVKKDNPGLNLFQEDRKYAILEDWIFLIENLFQDKIYLIDKFTIQQKIHNGRSMNNNELIIERKLLASKYLSSKLPFGRYHLSKMYASTYYFCAVHAYIEGYKWQSFEFIKKAIECNGLTKALLILLIKLSIGYSPSKRRKKI